MVSTAGVNLPVRQECSRAANDSASRAAPAVSFLMKQHSVFAVEGRRHGTSRRNEQLSLAGQQVSLRRQVVSRGVVLADVVAGPDDVAGLCIDGVQVDVFVREDAGSEVRNVVVDKDARSNRPARDHLASTKEPFVRRASSKLPDQFSGCCVEAVSKAVV